MAYGRCLDDPGKKAPWFYTLFLILNFVRWAFKTSENSLDRQLDNVIDLLSDNSD